MPTTVVKSIGATGRDYATIQAFFDAVPDLVAADQIWEGRIYPDGGNTVTGNYTVTKTTDATRFIRLRAAAGSSFVDNASIRTTPLRINATNGILLTPSTVDPIITHSCYLELVGLQLENTSAAHTIYSTAGQIYIRSCIIRSPSASWSTWSGLASSSAVTAVNSVFLGGNLYTAGGINPCVLDSCTFVNSPGSGDSLHIVYNIKPEIRNCAFFGQTAPLFSPGGFYTAPNGNNCAASATTLPVGGLTSQVSADQFEVYAIDGTADLRLKAGNTIGAAGVYNANILTDISGTTRNTSTPSVGAWEYVAAGDTTAPNLTSPTGTQTGSTTASGTVSTDEANGTLYYLASTNSTETAATVKAASSQAVTATGSQSVSFTSLTASTTYYAHYCHRDAAGNDSTVANSASFTTAAASTYAPNINKPRSGMGVNFYGAR